MQDKNAVYTELFENYRYALVRLCVTYKVHSDDIDDVVSECFKRSLVHQETFLELSPEQRRSWLYRAVYNIILEHEHKQDIVPLSEIENDEHYSSEQDDLNQFQREQEFQQYANLVYNSLDNEKDKELFLLVFDKKIDYQMLAEKYGIAPGAVRVMVHRLRQKLKPIVAKIIK